MVLFSEQCAVRLIEATRNIETVFLLFKIVNRPSGIEVRVILQCAEYIEDITRWRENINFLFRSGKNNISRVSEANE